MSDTLLANDPAARTESGEIKDQSLTTPDPTATTTETAPPVTEEKKPEAAAKPEDKSLLNKEIPGGAPEKYEPFKIPEGLTALPEASLAKVTEVFKGLNLDQGQAQSLIDLYHAQTAEIVKSVNDAANATRESWQAQLKADPEIGPRLPQVREAISRTLDSIGDKKLAQDFRDAMDQTGAGDHPAFAKVFYKLSRQVSEGKHVGGAAPSPAGQRSPDARPPSAAKALYPNLA